MYTVCNNLMIGVYCVSVSVVIMSMSVNIFVNTFIFLSNPMLCVCSSLNMLQKKPPELFYKKNCNFIKKETLTQVFSCGFCEILKNVFFTVNLRLLCVDASACVFERAFVYDKKLLPGDVLQKRCS